MSTNHQVNTMSLPTEEIGAIATPTAEDLEAAALACIEAVGDLWEAVAALDNAKTAKEQAFRALSQLLLDLESPEDGYLLVGSQSSDLMMLLTCFQCVEACK